MAMAKNKPASVGRITFPAQFARLRIPLLNDIGVPTPPSKAPVSRFLKHTALPGDSHQAHGRAARGKIDDGAHNRESRCDPA